MDTFHDEGYLQSYYFNSIYRTIVTRLITQPHYVALTKDGNKIYELVDFRFKLLNPFNCFATCREMSLKYLKGELDFYYSGSPYLKDIVKHSKFWNNVTDDGRTINSNYGKLLLYDRNLHNYTQFEYAKDMLLRNLESKKAVMTIYSKENAFKSNDNPCTMFLQFLVREGFLHLYVKMRSSDVWFGLPYDVPFFVSIQYKMLQQLNSQGCKLEIGDYYHQATSLHLYERNKETLETKLIENIKEKDTDEQYKLFQDYVLPYINKELK